MSAGEVTNLWMEPPMMKRRGAWIGRAVALAAAASALVAQAALALSPRDPDAHTCPSSNGDLRREP